MKDPVRYDPSFERPEPDETATVDGQNKALAEIMETTAEDMGHAIRSVHAKSHGFVAATLTVPPGLAPELGQGLFARPGDHPAILRF